jgi:hypothetical protein
VTPDPYLMGILPRLLCELVNQYTNNYLLFLRYVVTEKPSRAVQVMLLSTASEYARP